MRTEPKSGIGGGPPTIPVHGLQALAVLAGAGLAISGLYLTTGVGLPCPFRLVTGWDCPLCGGTRLGADLLSGHPAAAFHANPGLFVALIAVALAGIGRGLELLRGSRSRRGTRLSALLARVPVAGWVGIALGLAVVDTVLRHLV